MQGPVEDQFRHLTQVRLPRPGLAERLLGQGAAGGALKRGDRHRLLGGQEGQGVLPNQQFQPHAVLQRRARLWASVGSHRHLRPHQRRPAAGWVTQRNVLFYKMIFTGNGDKPLSPCWGHQGGLSSTLVSSAAFCFECLNCSHTKSYQPARSVILLALISLSQSEFYAAGNHSTSGEFSVRVVIKETSQTAAQMVSWLPNNSMEKDPGDFPAHSFLPCLWI